MPFAASADYWQLTTTTTITTDEIVFRFVLKT